MVGKYNFNWYRFRHDLLLHLGKSSMRKLSDDTDNQVSASTISRITTGNGCGTSLENVISLCSAIRKNPCDYVDRVMF